LRLRRRAAMTVEFALVAGIYLIVVFTMFEVGRLVMIHQIITEASRAGARRAVLENASEGAVKNHVASILNNSMLGSGTVTVTPTDLSTLGFGDPVVVTVNVKYADVSWIGAIWVTGNPTMTATSTMRAERPE
jgi:Flp pilus assembly protein TadG